MLGMWISVEGNHREPGVGKHHAPPKFVVNSLGELCIHPCSTLLVPLSACGVNFRHTHYFAKNLKISEG